MEQYCTVLSCVISTLNFILVYNFVNFVHQHTLYLSIQQTYHNFFRFLMLLRTNHVFVYCKT